jgi:hypothetical protein
VVLGSSCGEIPDTGAFDFAKDNTINVRLDCGYGAGAIPGNADIVKIFEEQLVPAAQQFKPELVLISCGFDLKKWDSHGCFDITALGVSQLTKIARDIADTYAEGRLVSMLEGGYSDVGEGAGICEYETYYGLASCAYNHIATLLTNDVQPETEYYKNGPPAECTKADNFKPSASAARSVPDKPIIDGDMLLLTDHDAHSTIVAVAIHDLRGRRIAGITPGSGVPSRIDLSLHAAQSGSYLVTCIHANGEAQILTWVCRK